MADNVNTEYEKLTQEIYQTISAFDGIQNVDIKHNVKIEGKSGCKHQIDVYWEFEFMGETHRVAIECKNYSKEVSVGRVRDFFGVLYDIGDIKGIFVTKVGYQSGAIKYSDYYNISLKELRFPTEKDWEGRIKDIIINIHAFTTNIKKREPEIDVDWLFKNTRYKEGDQISFNGLTTEFLIINSVGEKITDFYELESKLPHAWKVENDIEHKYSFDDAFLVLPNGDKFKLNGVAYVYDVLSDSSESVLEGEVVAKAIFKDIKNGTIKFLNKNGEIRDVRNAKQTTL
jgi:hypothetical protein